jgi:hypothetical protein
VFLPLRNSGVLVKTENDVRNAFDTGRTADITEKSESCQ